MKKLHYPMMLLCANLFICYTHCAAVKIKNLSNEIVLARINDQTVSWLEKDRKSRLAVYTASGIVTLGIVPLSLELSFKHLENMKFPNFRTIYPNDSITFHSGPKAIKKITFMRVKPTNITIATGSNILSGQRSHFIKKYGIPLKATEIDKHHWEYPLPNIQTFTIKTNIKPLSLFNRIEYKGWKKAKIV